MTQSAQHDGARAEAAKRHAPATHDTTHATGALDAATRKQITHDFKQAVNMTPAALTKWLETDDARRVGQKTGSSESVGHQSGKHILRILATPAGDLSDDDYRHMRKVAGYVHRHLAQGPTVADVKTSDWRYSLMNWGHDPMKD